MKNKILLFVIVLLLYVSIVSAGSIPISTHDYGLTCYFPQTHFMKIDDGVLRVNCFTNENNLSCVSKIYSMTSASDYDEILQTNPDVIVNVQSNIKPFFTPENNQLNVYFNDKNLLYGKDYLYTVECSGSSGIDLDSSYLNVSNNKLMYNLNYQYKEVGDNAQIYIIAFFTFIIIIALLSYAVHKLRGRR